MYNCTSMPEKYEMFRNVSNKPFHCIVTSQMSKYKIPLVICQRSVLRAIIKISPNTNLPEQMLDEQ